MSLAIRSASILAVACIQAGCEAQTAVPIERNAVILDGDGLLYVSQIGSSGAIPFETPISEVIAALSVYLEREPIQQGLIEDCGADFVNWGDDFTTYAYDGLFVGWAVNGTADLATASGLTIGSTRAVLEESRNLVIEESTLGTEFVANDIAGLLASDAPSAQVTNLWAGYVCNFR